jgi:hypothetical protein
MQNKCSQADIASNILPLKLPLILCDRHMILRLQQVLNDDTLMR